MPTVATVGIAPLLRALFSSARINSAAAQRASRRSGIKTPPEPLPLRPPRIVDMNMGIHKSRQDGGFAAVMDFLAVWYLIRRNDRLNLLSFHKDGRWADPFGSDHSSSDKGLQIQNV